MFDTVAGEIVCELLTVEGESLSEIISFGKPLLENKSIRRSFNEPQLVLQLNMKGNFEK